MKKRIYLAGWHFTILLFLMLIFSVSVPAQHTSLTCTDLKEGIFYFYPKNATDVFMDIRQGDVLKETNLTSGDTAIWHIKWQDDCTFSLKFITTNSKLPDETIKLFKKHTLVYQILHVTNDYYTFKGYFDNTSNAPIQNDTIWLHKKIIIPDTKLFSQVSNNTALKKHAAGDTATFATLYIYRQKKLLNMLGDYLIYFDGNLMCVAKNNTGYIFKIYKEGNFEVKSKLLKDESSVNLNVAFGKTYYVKSMIHWGITSRLYNFRLEMAEMNATDGKDEFEAVDLE